MTNNFINNLKWCKKCVMMSTRQELHLIKMEYVMHVNGQKKRKN